MVKHTTLALAVWLGTLGMLSVRPAFADDGKARASELFQRGNALYESGRYSEACTHYEQASELYPSGLGIRVRLGVCLRKTQKLARAYEVLASARADAERQEAEFSRAGDKEKAAAVRKLVEQADHDAKEIELSLSWVELVLGEDARAAPGLEIERDGARVDWKSRVPVEKGAHAFVARSSGKTFWSSTIDVPRVGSSQTVVVEGGPAKPASKRKTAGFVVIGGGGALLLAGAGLEVVSVLKKSDVEATNHCNSANVCDSIGLPRWRDANTFGIAGAALLAASGVAIGVGVVLVVTAPTQKGEPAVQAFVGPGEIGLRGRF